MKQIVSILCLSLVLIRVEAQTAVNYLKVYHPVISEAEKSIISEKYHDALDKYGKAFASVPRGFMKDYFNAAVCATYLGDATTTYKYLLEVAGKGISLDFIKNETAFYAIQKDPEWRNFEKQYLEKKREFDSTINQNVKEKLNKMMERSNWFRSKNAEAFADTLKKIDAQNATELDYIIAKYGFPDEEMIGCGEDGMPIIQYPFYTIIRQQTPDNQTVNFANIIFDAMRKGKILPHTGTYLLASVTGNDIFFARNVYKVTTDKDLDIMQNKPFSPKLDKWVYRKLSPQEEQNFSELRLANGLDTMADYRKKIAFSLKDNRFLMPYKVFVSMWFVTDPNIASDYLEGTAILD